MDFVNSVQFSNHTGYPTFTGEVLDGAQLEALAKGLDDNGLLRGVSHLLTGYIGSTSFLRAVCAVHLHVTQRLTLAPLRGREAYALDEERHLCGVL